MLTIAPNKRMQQSRDISSLRIGAVVRAADPNRYMLTPSTQMHNTVTVNPDRGFYEHWSSEFLNHYGSNSNFAYGLSDMFTQNLVGVLEKNGNDIDYSTVKQYLDDEDIVISIRDLQESVPSIGKELSREAFGTAPIGTVMKLVDEVLGKGRFLEWLSALESKSYELCDQISGLYD